MKPDPTTQSNYLQIATDHVSLDWLVDFDAAIIKGTATHKLIARVDDVNEVIFDTSDLIIESVSIGGTGVSYEVKPKHPVMGSALHVPLESPIKAGSSVSVSIQYSTTKDCTALQWLDKEQTQGKTFPYLFSQCQPIHARALAPLQDTPSLKIKYSAKVTSILPALMSAIRVSPPSDGLPHDGKEIGKDLVTYTYDQPTGIPSYLIAIACGNVRYKALPLPHGKTYRSGIWAEPELIDAAYWEFSEDTGRFLAKEEEIVVPYKFGVYDLLVLPPSFPYGGMENACLTFLTPTLLAGDRSLVNVVVHELTHSWFGNGVTQADSSSFWLNEGWTTYMERVLLQVLYSPAERGFSYIIGRKALDNDLKNYADRPKYQRLVIDFEVGEDPDDAYSRVPYDKGANFLLYLERTLGGLDAFLPYIRDYVNTFMGQSIDTFQWKNHLLQYWEKNGSAEQKAALAKVNFDAWFFGEGLKLPVDVEYDESLATKAYALAERWNSSRATAVGDLDFKASDMDGFNSNQKIVFLERLHTYPALPPSHVVQLGELYGFSTTQNAEIKLRFYEVALVDPSAEQSKAFAIEAAKWVVGEDGSGVIKGRMKFCRPIFREVYKVDEKLAVDTFTRSESAFHPIARNLIKKDLKIA